MFLDICKPYKLSQLFKQQLRPSNVWSSQQESVIIENSLCDNSEVSMESLISAHSIKYPKHKSLVRFLIFCTYGLEISEE